MARTPSASCSGREARVASIRFGQQFRRAPAVVLEPRASRLEPGFWGLAPSPRASRPGAARERARRRGAFGPCGCSRCCRWWWWAAIRTRTSLGRRHLAVATVLRSAALVFVVLGLLRPVWTAPVTQVSVVYALDVSRSVASGFVQSALQFAQRANREAKPEAVRYVVFAERAWDGCACGGRGARRSERCAAGRSHAAALSGRHQPRACARPVVARAIRTG